MPGATLCGTIIFSLGSPGTYTLESPLVTRSPSLANLAFLIKNRISLLRSPDLVVGVFPDIRWYFAALQESLFSCACLQAALLKKVLLTWLAPRVMSGSWCVTGCSGAHLDAGSSTVVEISEMNLWIEQTSDVQSDGCRDW